MRSQRLRRRYQSFPDSCAERDSLSILEAPYTALITICNGIGEFSFTYKTSELVKISTMNILSIALDHQILRLFAKSYEQIYDI